MSRLHTSDGTANILLTSAAIAVVSIAVAFAAGHSKYALLGIAALAVAVTLVLCPVDVILGYCTIITTALVVFIPYGQLAGTREKSLIPAAVLLFGVMVLLRGRRLNLRATQLALAWLVLSILTTYAHGLANTFFWSRVAILLVAILCAAGLSERERRLVLRGVLWIAAIEALLSIWEELTRHQPLFAPPGRDPLTGAPVVLPSHTLGTSAIRAQGTLGHPLILSAILMFGIAAAMVPWTASNRTRKAVGLLCAIGIICSGSIGTVFAGLIVLIAVFLARAKPRERVNAIILGGLAIFGGLYAGAASLSSITGLFAEQEVTHRFNSFVAINELFVNRDWSEILFGDGWNSVGRLFSAGVVSSVDTLQVFDNQYASTFADTGIAGLLVLAAFFALAFRYANLAERVIIGTSLILFFSFDLLAWSAPTVILMVFSVISLARHAEGTTSNPAKTSIKSSIRVPEEKAIGVELRI